MYSYNLRQLKMLSLTCSGEDYRKAFEYVGFYGADNEIEVQRLMSVGLINYITVYCEEQNNLDLFDSVINFLMTTHNIK